MLHSTSYGQNDYYLINFNSFSEAFFTVFHFLVVNNWPVTLSGMIAVSSKWSLVYYILFYLIVVLVILSVVVTFFVDVFSLQVGFILSGR